MGRVGSPRPEPCRHCPGQDSRARWCRGPSACARAGLRSELAVTTEAPYIPLPSTWDAYLKALTKKHRQQLRYALRDFDAWASDSQRLESVTTPAELEKGLAVLVDLHKQRWHDPAEGGVRSNYNGKKESL